MSDPVACLPTKPSRFKVPQFWLALLLTAGEFVLLYVVFIKGIPDANKEIAYILVGGYTSEWAGMLRFFSGTTQGSTEKNDIIKKAQPVQE